MLDIKPYNRARSLNSNASKVDKKEEENLQEVPKTKVSYLKRLSSIFKKPKKDKNDDISPPSKPENTTRKLSRSFTTNKVYPQPILSGKPLDTVEDEGENQFDLEMFDKELLLESNKKIQNKEYLRALFERLQQLIKYEEEDYVYQNLHDSEEENEENDKKFKLIDSALLYEKELSLLSNVEPFYSLYPQKKNAFEMLRMYSDPYPLLELRKKIMFIKW